MPITPKYETTVTVIGGRGEGRAMSDDGVLNIALRRPNPNGKSEGTNPEQLFAAAWGSCYQQALMGVSKKAGVDASDSTVKVTVQQGEDPADGGYALAAKINVEIPGVDTATAQKLADEAHQACPYSKATRGNIDVEVTAS